MTNNIQAIVYTSNTGHSEEYARLIGEATELPVYELKEAKRALSKGLHILYLGWINSGRIQGYDRAVARFAPRGVCAVGILGNPAQIPELRRINRIPDDVAVFPLRGGLEMDKLKGTNKLVMEGIRTQVIEMLSRKEDRNEEEDEMLTLLKEGGSQVNRRYLNGVLGWLSQTPPNRPGHWIDKETTMSSTPKRSLTGEDPEREKWKQEEIARRRLAQLGLDPEELEQTRKLAYARNATKGRYQRIPNAPLGSPDNPVELETDGSCNILQFDLERGYWILSDGKKTGWSRF